jgi:hypothetical protein
MTRPGLEPGPPRRELYTKLLSGNLKGINHSDELRVGRRIILKEIFKKS